MAEENTNNSAQSSSGGTSVAASNAEKSAQAAAQQIQLRSGRTGGQSGIFQTFAIGRSATASPTTDASGKDESSMSAEQRQAQGDIPKATEKTLWWIAAGVAAVIALGVAWKLFSKRKG